MSMNRLSKNDIKYLVLTLPDKYQWPSTTSHEFKNFLIDKFYGSDCDILEVGCHKGQTSLILSHLFNKVFAMNINPPSDDFPDRQNIIYEQMDSYNDEWKFDKWKNVDVVMIDAIHEYNQVKLDTENALKLNPKYIIFDDYGVGLFPGVKQYVDEFIMENNFEIVPVGLEKGKMFKSGERLVDSEGLMIKL